MTLLRIAAGRLILPVLLLLGSLLLVNSAFDAWSTAQRTETLASRLQVNKAEATAAWIGQHITAVQSQAGWTTFPGWATAPVEQRRIDFLRLQRQVPAITEAIQIDQSGKEVLMVSSLAVDRIGRGTDFSDDPRFREAQARKTYLGPVYFRKPSEPYVSLAVSNREGVNLFEINMKPLWDLISALSVGENGFAYVVDGTGRLIAHRDSSLLLRRPDLSTLPQVAAALTSTPSNTPFLNGEALDETLAHTKMASTWAAVPALGWWVFVDVPASEARAPLWGALFRVGGMLGLAIVAALAASVLVRRRRLKPSTVPAAA